MCMSVTRLVTFLLAGSVVAGLVTSLLTLARGHSRRRGRLDGHGQGRRSRLRLSRADLSLGDEVNAGLGLRGLFIRGLSVDLLFVVVGWGWGWRGGEEVSLV